MIVPPIQSSKGKRYGEDIAWKEHFVISAILHIYDYHPADRYKTPRIDQAVRKISVTPLPFNPVFLQEKFISVCSSDRLGSFRHKVLKNRSRKCWILHIKKQLWTASSRKLTVFIWSTDTKTKSYEQFINGWWYGGRWRRQFPWQQQSFAWKSRIGRMGSWSR